MINIYSARVYGKKDCPFCLATKNLLTALNISYVYEELGENFDRDWVLNRFPDAKTYPQITINVEHPEYMSSYDIGGYQELRDLISLMELEQLLTEHSMRIHFEKTDGTLREMVCTLRTDLIPEGEEGRGKKARNIQVIPVWDLEKEAWRSFRYDSVKDFEVV